MTINAELVEEHAVSLSDEEKHISTRNEKSWQSGVQSLSDGIRHLYESSLLSDCTYEINGKRIHAHRLILGARSPIFRQTLLESKISGPICDDCSEIGFEALIRYIYLNELNISTTEEILETYRVAKKYVVEELVDECNQLIEGWEISSSNVCTSLSEALDIDFLKERCLQYIKQNSQEVLVSEDFKKLSPGAVVEILDQKCIINVPTIDLIHSVLGWSLEQFPKLEDCTQIRIFLLNNKILGKLNFQKLSHEDILSVDLEYPELLTAKESRQLQLHAYKPEKMLPLPKWCEF